MNVAREGLATAVAPDGRIYALGGNDSEGNALSSVEMLDPCGDRTWTPVAPMLAARTQFAAATGPDGRIYAIGGRDERDGTPLATVNAYDPASNSWSTVPSLAVPRGDLGVATGPDGLIYAIGGSIGGGLVPGAVGVETSTVEAYDTATNQWKMVTPLSVPRHRLGAATGPDGRVYAVSADTNTTGLSFKDTAVPGPVESYAPGPDDRPGTWQKESYPDRVLQGRMPYGPAVTTDADGLMYVIGGFSSFGVATSLRSVFVHDTTADTWSVAEALTTRRWRHGAAAGRDGRVYAIGGIDLDLSAVEREPPLASTESLKVGPDLCRGAPPADFDGDGDTDFSVFRPSSGTWFAKDGTTVAYGAEGDIPVPADYDGDRVTDVAIFRPSTGLWAIHRSSDDTDVFLTYGIGTDIPVPADYDGDAKADIAIYRPEFGLWWERHSSTGVDVPTTFGIGTDIPVPADYDGDAKSDIAVFRDGTWFTLPSGGGEFIATSYGNPNDIPVPADYDADHTIDRAVFRPSTGTWHLKHSSDDTDEVVSFGIGGDVPVPGDYNADGIADPAVYRAGQWFTEPGLDATWGLATDIPLPPPAAVRMA